MASLPVTIPGARIELFTNNLQFKEVASVNFTVEYSEETIFGIDSVYGQEIAGGKITVSGSVKSFRLILSGGLQAKSLRSLFTDVSASPYVSIRISDRKTSEDIIFIPQAKITRESHTIPTKGVYMIDFDFVGLIPFFALDRS